MCHHKMARNMSDSHDIERVNREGFQIYMVVPGHVCGSQERESGWRIRTDRGSCMHLGI